MTSRYQNYRNELTSDAQALVNDYWEVLVKALKDGDRIDHSFIDEKCYLHEYVDSLYIDFEDAFYILQNCDEEETDSGLWEGQSPKDAIETMAFFTYRNELYRETQGLFKEKLEELLETEQDKLDRLSDKLESLQTRLDNLEYDTASVDSDEDIPDAEELEQQIADLEDEISEQQDYVNNIERAIDEFSN